MSFVYGSCGELQAGKHILDRELRVMTEDITGSQALGQQCDDSRYRHSSAGNARDATHDPVIDTNSCSQCGLPLIVMPFGWHWELTYLTNLRSYPPGPCTRTVRYSPMSNWSFVVAARVVPPVTPVFDCQVTVQVEVAVTGQVPVPLVRSLSDRQLYL